MNFLKDLVNMVKKYCDDDVCLMIVFVIFGFSLCYLFKRRISGFVNFAPFGEETGNPSEETGTPSEKVINDPQIPGTQMENKVGIELRERKPEPSPSTKRALEVMAQKPPVENKMINQRNGLLVQDSMIFKPFDEVWNPGFMPLDMVFKNIQKPMGQDRPMGPSMGQDRPMGPSMGQDRPMGPSMGQDTQPSPSGGSDVNLVLVYAPWCGHSKRMLPDFERVKSEFDGKTINGKNINIIMYNSDVDKDKVKEYGVQGFPSLFLEKDGNRESFPHRSYDKISVFLNSL
jgi:thiol-disulfide isomerase/thioredoxin